MADKIRVLIVDDLPETRENVRKLLQFEPDVEVVAQAGDGQEAVALAKEHRPDIILMDINMPGLDGIGASQAIVNKVPSAQIIIMSVQSEADYLRRAMLAGARDFLMKPFSGDELITAIRRAHQIRPASRPAMSPASEEPSETAPKRRVRRERGHIVSVYSPKGGCGCSSIAINLAVSLADLGHETLLVDGSLQFGDVAVMLDMKPTTTIVDLMERIEDLDADLIGSVVMRHGSGLKVLVAPPRPEMADLVLENKIQTLFEALRSHFSYIIIDTSSNLDDVALAMLDSSERILIITEQNLPSLKNVSRFFDLAETLNYPREKVLLIVNRSSERAGISVNDISEKLRRPVIATIPDQDTIVERAANLGTPIVSGRDQRRPIATALKQLASTMEEEFAADGSERELREKAVRIPFLKRLFGLVQRSEVAG